MSLLKGGGNICQFCSTNTNFYPRFLTFTNFPDATTCPFPKVSRLVVTFLCFDCTIHTFQGNYTITDYKFDDEIFPPNVPYGTYVVKTTFSKDNQNIFGISMEISVSQGG